jgi:hypothetical protein
MKIASSTLDMTSTHVSQQHYELQESLRAWIGNRRPDFSESAMQTSPLPAVTTQLSDAGKAAQANEATALQDQLETVENDPILRLIRAMILAFTGREARVFNAADLQVEHPASSVPNPTPSPESLSPPAQAAGFGIEYDRRESYSESEQTNLQASGVVRTADGKEIAFSLALSMSRSYHEESSTSLRLGDARQKQDPLVINFNGSAAQLTSQRFKFDLNADGQNEDINFATNGSGFLALDRNGDGRINNGSELFGASSGNGFAELALLDSDHNGWIDENDAAYGQLRILTKDASGQDQLSSLKEKNVGALSVESIATPFALKDERNNLQGQITRSAIYLKEDGAIGTVQQIDLTV